MISRPIRVAFAAAGLLALGACASHPAEQAGLRPALPVTINEPETEADAYGLFLAGQAALDKGSSREAAFYLGRASALDDSPFLKERAFTAAVVAGDLARAAGSAPNEGEGTAASVRLGRLVQAVEDLSQNKAASAVARLSGDPGQGATARAIVLLRPWAAAAAGDWENAVKFDASQDPLTNLFGAYGQAQLLERAGKTEEAGAAYRGLAAGSSPVFTLGYGLFLERQGKAAQAVQVYDRLLARNRDSSVAEARARAAARKKPPGLPSLRSGAAQALIAPAAGLMAGRQQELAVTLLQLALRLDPTMDEGWLLVGDAMAGAGDIEASRAAYGRVPANSSSYTTARGRIAWSLAREGQTEEALKLAKETAAKNPKDREILSVYADILRSEGRHEDAIAVMDRLLALSDDKQPGTWRLRYLRAVSLEQSGRWPEAEAELQRALKLKPDDPQIMNYLAFGWANRGVNLKPALEMLQKAAAMQPRSGQIIDSLGWARYRLGDFKGAVGDLERASGFAPYDPDINDHLGDAYWRTGRKVEAVYQWRRVLTLDPDPKTREGVEAKLRSGLVADASAPAPPVQESPGVTAQIDPPRS
jgi:tetratricopeptide (TPR) repeat protein